MIFEVETDGTNRRVEIADQAGQYRVVCGATSYIVDAAWVDAGWSLLIDVMTHPQTEGREGSQDLRVFGGSTTKSSDRSDVQARRSYDVVFGPELGDERVVYVNRKAVTVRMAKRIGRPRTARGRAATGDRVDVQRGALGLVAPMPGRVVKVLVEVGDLVSAGQGVAVVEAMKMENEVRAPRAGTIKEVRVTQGTLVEARAVLVVIE